jgi:hypothetical protein
VLSYRRPASSFEEVMKFWKLKILSAPTVGHILL